MKFDEIKCLSCGKNILENDGRIDIPTKEVAQMMRDHDTVFHPNRYKVTLTK